MRSLEDLYRTYGAVVRCQIQEMVANASDVDDLVDEVLLAYWQRYGTRSQTAPTGPLLFRMTMDAALRHFRLVAPPEAQRQQLGGRDASLAALHWQAGLTAAEVAEVTCGSVHEVQTRLKRLAPQPLQRRRRSPQCLSGLAIFLLAAGDRAQTAAEREHLGACSLCGERLAKGVAGSLSFRQAPLPPRLQGVAAAERRLVNLNWRRLRRQALPGVALAAVVLCITAAAWGTSAPTTNSHPGTPPPPAHALIPAPTIDAVLTNATGSRAVAALSDDLAVEPGDALRLHIQVKEHATVVLREVGGETLYDGPLPADGWLPGSVLSDGDGPLRLQARVCVDGACWRGGYRFAQRDGED